MPASLWSACCTYPERRSRLAALLALVCLWAGALAAAAADELEVSREASSKLISVTLIAAAADELEVSREGGTIFIRGEFDLPVPLRAVWATLTDYTRFADFVPDVTYSRWVAGSAGERRLDLRGENRVLFFRAEYRALLALQEDPEERIRFKAVSGNFKALEGEWRLSPNGAGTRIAYYARLVPDFWVPPLVGPLLIRYNVRRQLEGMVREMERRGGPVPPPGRNQ